MTTIRRLTLDNKTIEYRIVRSNRRKTSELFVDSRSVLIRTPAEKSGKEVERIIKAKAGWIAKKQEEYRHSASQITNPTFEDGSHLPYMGVGHPLHIITDAKFKEEKMRLTNGEFLVTLKRSGKHQQRKIQKLYDAWLQQKVQTILEEKVKKYANLVNASPSKIVVKDMKNRWGSATNLGVLNFSLNLLKAPENVIDYIVLHEVCHLKIKDHSHNFWNLVRQIMPAYRDKAKWLTSHAEGLVE